MAEETESRKSLVKRLNGLVVEWQTPEFKNFAYKFNQHKVDQLTDQEVEDMHRGNRPIAIMKRIPFYLSY